MKMYLQKNKSKCFHINNYGTYNGKLVGYARKGRHGGTTNGNFHCSFVWLVCT